MSQGWLGHECVPVRAPCAAGEYNYTGLMWAAVRGKVDLNKILLGAGADTEAFCMPAACEDAAVGIDCFCFLGGVTPTTEPLPAGCIDSGEIAVAVPSSLELAIVAKKPPFRHHGAAAGCCCRCIAIVCAALTSGLTRTVPSISEYSE